MTDIVTLQLGKGIVRTMDKARLNLAVKTAATNRGLSDMVKDCHAQFTKKDHPDTFKKLSEAAVDRKIAALYNGDLRVHTPTMTVEEILESADIATLKAMLAKKEKAAKTA